ncbi:hypothetical protein THARTR1_03907 [Trichoderma harzianum]|uniref:Uncharacterized protein n=1 Tax=Trichoderma harzianum TaxID=5544 RepID=A0A2K0UDW5_TRIHA|nr:hypothetical protein THARTR1_03907 [Trichoderma harzianum]
MNRRTTWTRFHLPRWQGWPTWSTGSSILGPLAEVTGYNKVWLGRQVDDPEQAAIIIREYFSLGFHEVSIIINTQQQQCGRLQKPSRISKTLQHRLSLNDAENTGTAVSPTASRFPSLHWHYSNGKELEVEGRVTLTTLLVPYTGGPDLEQIRLSIVRAFKGFVPADCEDLRPPPPLSRDSIPLGGQWPGLVAFLPKPDGLVWAWTDTGDNEQWQPPGQSVAAEQNGSGQMVVCQFRLWNGLYGATRQREEASAKNALAKESWETVVSNVFPPVTAWEQERWDIQVAPSYLSPLIDEEEEEEAGEI